MRSSRAILITLFLFLSTLSFPLPVGLRDPCFFEGETEARRALIKRKEKGEAETEAAE
jgi:hypothetical protein